MLERLFGPLFTAEVLRLGRGPWLVRLRVAVGLMALVGVGLAWQGWAAEHGRNPWAPFEQGPRISQQEWANFGGRAALALLAAQLLALIVLTPAYVAGAVPEERQRGTLDLLLVAGLSDAEIVSGKIAARVVHLLAVMLTTVPVLTGLLVFGGTSPALLAEGMAASAMWVVAIATVSASVSLAERTPLEASVPAYVYTAMLALPAFLCVGLPWADACLPGLPLLIALWTAGVTYRLLQVRARAGLALPPESLPSPPAADDAAAGMWKRPPVTDEPLWWKETDRASYRVGADDRLLSWTFAGLAAVQFLLMLPGRLTGDVSAGQWTSYLRLLTVELLAGTVAAGYLVAGSVSGERQRQTLDALRMLPAGRGELLAVKALAGPWRLRPLAYGLAVVWLGGLFSGGLHPLGLVLLLLTAAAQLTFFVGLGLWLSVTCATPLRSGVYYTAVVALVCVAGWPTGRVPGAAGLVEALTPPWAWWEMVIGLGGPPEGWSHWLPGAVFGLAAQAAVGAVLLWRARRCFDPPLVRGAARG
jgi:ABC-type transport system involved in multi-copper enzyme maturation permease subunit